MVGCSSVGRKVVTNPNVWVQVQLFANMFLGSTLQYTTVSVYHVFQHGQSTFSYVYVQQLL